MKGRIGPVARPFRVSLFFRIVDVIDMAGEVAFVAQSMFPVAPLPDTPSAFRDAARRAPFARRQGDKWVLIRRSRRLARLTVKK